MANASKAIHRLAGLVARIFALLGGVVLLALVAITCLSVVGRGLNTLGNTDWLEALMPSLAGFLSTFRPITGDFELVEMGVAVAIFCFLPWCQLNKGHAAVDIFTAKFLPPRFEKWLLFVWEVLLTLIIALITWRLYVGMGDKMLYSETTFLLQWPIWWAYAVCVFVGCVATLVGVSAVLSRFHDALWRADRAEAFER